MTSDYRSNLVISTRRNSWPQRLAGAAIAALLIILLGRGMIVSAEEDASRTMSAAEAAAFEAGRVTAHADLAGVTAAAYQQGLIDGAASVAAAASAVQP